MPRPPPVRPRRPPSSRPLPSCRPLTRPPPSDRLPADAPLSRSRCRCRWLIRRRSRRSCSRSTTSGSTSRRVWRRARSTRVIWWTVNDSGDTARVFGINASGKVKAELSFKAPVKDVEAIAVDREGTIYIADIGDNKASRDMIEVYTIPEPTKLADGDEREVPPVRLQVPRRRARRRDAADRPGDATRCSSSPRSRRAWAASTPAPEQASREGTNELTKLADGPAGVTDGTFLPDGQTVVLRSYVDIARVAWGETPKVVGRADHPARPGRVGRSRPRRNRLGSRRQRRQGLSRLPNVDPRR